MQYTHHNRPAIIAVANTVPVLGMQALFPILPELVAVSHQYYMCNLV